MRTPFLPAPNWEGMQGLEVHEIIRDFPELLLPLRETGVGLQKGGAMALRELFVGRTGEAKVLERSLVWRGIAAV